MDSAAAGSVALLLLLELELELETAVLLGETVTAVELEEAL